MVHLQLDLRLHPERGPQFVHFKILTFVPKFKADGRFGIDHEGGIRADLPLPGPPRFSSCCSERVGSSQRDLFAIYLTWRGKNLPGWALRGTRRRVVPTPEFIMAMALPLSLTPGEPATWLKT